MNLYILDDGRLRSGWRFFISVVVVVLANYLADTLSNGVAGRNWQLQELIYRSLLLFLELAAFLGITRLFDQPPESSWDYNGLRRRNWLPEACIGAALGFSMVTIAVAVIGACFRLHLEVSLNNRMIAEGFVVFGMILAGAMAEELVFRGYPFQRLVEGLGALRAVIILSALFGAAHLANPHVSDNKWVRFFAFSNTLLIGVVLALAYLRTKALWVSWGLHFGWNVTLGLLYGLPVSGISQFSVLVKSRVTGPEWVLGGRYGLEGGALGTLVILAGLAYVVFFIQPKSTQPAAPIPEPPLASIQGNDSL